MTALTKLALLCIALFLLSIPAQGAFGFVLAVAAVVCGALYLVRYRRDRGPR